MNEAPKERPVIHESDIRPFVRAVVSVAISDVLHTTDREIALGRIKRDAFSKHRKLSAYEYEEFVQAVNHDGRLEYDGLATYVRTNTAD